MASNEYSKVIKAVIIAVVATISSQIVIQYIAMWKSNAVFEYRFGSVETSVNGIEDKLDGALSTMATVKENVALTAAEVRRNEARIKDLEADTRVLRGGGTR